MDSKILKLALAEVVEAVNAIPEKPASLNPDFSYRDPKNIAIRETRQKFDEAVDRASKAVSLLDAAIDAI